MRILIACEDPRIPTGFGTVCRSLCRLFASMGNQVYAAAFNSQTRPGPNTDFENCVILPNLSLQRSPGAAYGGPDLIRFYDRNYSFDAIVFCNDSHRFRYVLDLPDDLLAKSVYVHLSEAEVVDSMAMRIMSLCGDFVFTSSYSKGINSVEFPEAASKPVIPVPFDVEMFSPSDGPAVEVARAAAGLQGKYVVLRMDRNQPRKQWQSTLRAFAAFSKVAPEAILYCKCDISDPAAQCDLPSLATRLEIGDRVRFDGNLVPRGSLAASVYRMGDVFFSTTSGEGLGLTLCEASLCGLPLIVTGAGPISEMVGPGAMLVKPLGSEQDGGHSRNVPDEKGFADALEEMYNDWKSGGRRALTIGSDGRRHVLAFFSKVETSKSWRNVLASVAGRGRGVSVVKGTFPPGRRDVVSGKSKYVIACREGVSFQKGFDPVDDMVSALEDNPSAGIVGLPVRRDWDVSGPIPWLDGTCMAMRSDDARKFGLANANGPLDMFRMCVAILESGKYVAEMPAPLGIEPLLVPVEVAVEIGSAWGAQARSELKVAIHCDLSSPGPLASTAMAVALELMECSVAVHLNDVSGSMSKWIPSRLDVARNAAVDASRRSQTWNFGMTNLCFLHPERAHDLSCGPVKACFFRGSPSRQDIVALVGMDAVLVWTDAEKRALLLQGLSAPIHVVPPIVLGEFMETEVSHVGGRKDFLVSCGCADDGILSVAEAFREEFSKGEDVRLVVRARIPSGKVWDRLVSMSPMVSVYSNDGAVKGFNGVAAELSAAFCVIQYDSVGMSPGCIEAVAVGVPYIRPASCGSAVMFGDNSPLGVECAQGRMTKAGLRMTMRSVYEERPGVVEAASRDRTVLRGICSRKAFSGDILPLLFGMRSKVSSRQAYTRFNAASFKRPQLPLIGDNCVVDVVIPTRDRRPFLCAALSSLACQSCGMWNLVLVCDDEDESMLSNRAVQGVIQGMRLENHRVTLVRGGRRGPHFAHARALEVCQSDLVMRIDDDCTMHPDCLDKLRRVFVEDSECMLAAAGPLVLDPFRGADGLKAPTGYREMDAYSGRAVNPKPDLQTHTGCGDGFDIAVEHLYSSFMFRRPCATAVGGYCLDYSQAGFREETDLTCRMGMAGWRLLVIPSAKVYHLSSPSGGVRSVHGDSAGDDRIYRDRFVSWTSRK
jgi:glycosyltransferase involved in cell wall biosynthesis